MPNPLAERPTSPPFAASPMHATATSDRSLAPTRRRGRATGALLLGGLAIAASVLAFLSIDEPSREPLERPARAAEAAAKPVPAAAPTDSTHPRLSGTLRSEGSDTLNHLMAYWAEEFRRLHPDVRVVIEGKGSSKAPPALLSGAAQIGPMSREMKASEIAAFKEKFGYEPTRIRIALDALAIYVHKDSPVERLTLAQVDALFGKERKQGFATDALTWGDVGVTGDRAALPVSLYGRNSASGTYGFFRESVLKNGDFKETVKEQPGSVSVVLGVTEDRGGVGYSGIGYKTSGVRAVPLAKDDAARAIAVSEATVHDGSYPITRHLYLYFKKSPGLPLDPLVKEFLAYVLSSRGQQSAVKNGYFALPADVAAEQWGVIQ